MILLMTGAGLGIGSIVGWLMERHPLLFVSDGSVNKAIYEPKTFLFTLLFVIGLVIDFWRLGSGSFSISKILVSGTLLFITWGASFFDFRYQLIPNRLILVGITGWGIFAIMGELSFLHSIVAGVCSAALMLLIRLLGQLFYQKAGMGMGDVKLVFLIGLFIQWEVFWVVYLAIMLGGLWAIGGLFLKKIDRSSRLPFAPFLWIAVSIVTFISFNEFISIWI